MISDWKLWTCAQKMVNEHGADAATQAETRAEQLAQRDDPMGAAVWRDILSRIAVLQAEWPPSAPVNRPWR